MPGLVSGRFFGDDVLESCLAGHRMFEGSGDPTESVAAIQQALSDLGFDVTVDGVFGAKTGSAVTSYKTSKGLSPTDPVVGPGTMAALDADFAHELFDAKGSELAGTRFDLGFRISTRIDLSDGLALCGFQNGLCVEIAHAGVYAMPLQVAAAWNAAGAADGTFGLPTGDPLELDSTRAVQEFSFVAHIFGPLQEFSLPQAVWQAYLGGSGMIGLPLGEPQPLGEGGTIVVQHERGVVLSVPGESPQPLPQGVFDMWAAQEAGGASLGPPIAFGFPVGADTFFSFRFGGITLDASGVASLAPVSSTLERYFQPADIDQQLTPKIVGTKAAAMIGGNTTLASMRADIESTSGPSDFIYIASWHCNIDLPLPGVLSPNLRTILAAKAASGVQIRAMLWAGDPVPGPRIGLLFPRHILLAWILIKLYARRKTSRPFNEPAVKFINSLSAPGVDSAAILDDRHLLFGSHHQKIVIVKAGAKLVAHVGGIEPNEDRLPPPTTLGSPLFDVSVKYEDAGAFLALQTFILRWKLHPDRSGAPLRGEAIALPLPSGGPLTVQMTHTYGRGFPLKAAVQTAANAISNGIKNARQFFYIEDQYMVGSPKMEAAIRDVLTNSDVVAILVIAAEDSVDDLPDLPFRRRVFMGPLVKTFSDRVLVFERLGDNGSTTGPGAYLHSKLMVVDDEVAFVGSVNSSRRSWFHDSEIQATVIDTSGPGGTAPGTRGWVRDLRCELWAQHLNVPAGTLGDPAKDIALWRSVIAGTAIKPSVRPYDVGAKVGRFKNFPPFLLNKAWDLIEDPPS